MWPAAPVICARTSSDDDRDLLRTRSFACSGMPLKSRHLQDVGVTHLILDGKAQEIKVLHRILEVPVANSGICCSRITLSRSVHGREQTLTQTSLPPVKHGVLGSAYQVGHTDFVYTSGGSYRNLIVSGGDFCDGFTSPPI